MRVRKIVIPLFIAAAAGLSLASVAFACTIVSGQTYFNGATSASAVHGATISNITVDGIQSGAPTTGWKVVAGTQQNYCMTYSSTIVAGPLTRVPSATPQIASTSGPAPSTAGTYYVCAISGSYSTNWAVLTVT